MSNSTASIIYGRLNITVIERSAKYGIALRSLNQSLYASIAQEKTQSASEGSLGQKNLTRRFSSCPEEWSYEEGIREAK
jgi:hypothetical protein